MSRLSKGSMTKTSKTEIVDDAMGARYDKFLTDLRTGKIKSKSGVTARDLERAEYGIMEAAPRFNARDMGQYGFNPFLGRGILNRDVDPVLSKLGYSGGFVPNFMVGSMAQRMSAKQAAFQKEHGAGAPTQQYLADWGWRNKNQAEWLRHIQKQRGSKNLDFTKLSDDYASFIPHQHQFKGLLPTDQRLAFDNVLAASQSKWEAMKTSPGLTKAMENRFDGFVPNFSMAALMKWAQTAKPKDLTRIGGGAEGTAWATPKLDFSRKFHGNIGNSMVTKSPIDMKAVDVLKGLRQGTKGTYDDIAKNDPLMAMRLDALAFEGAVTKAAAKSGIPVEPLVGHAPAAGIIKNLVTPLHKTSLGQMGMLDSKFIGELSEAMVVKGLTGKSSKFLTNDLLKADNFSVRNVEQFEKAFLEGASAKAMVDKGLVRILDAGGLQPIISSANFTKYFQKHGAGSKERDPIAIREYLQRAEGDYRMADFIGLGSQKTGVQFVSGGHVPNFGMGQMFSQYMKFGGGQGGRIRKQLAESVPRRENMWTNPDHGFRGLDLKGFLGIPKQSKVKIAEWLGASKKLSVDEKIGRYDRYMNLAARGAGKKSINSYMTRGSSPGWQAHYARASDGFIPSFSKDPLERSIRGEKLGIQMSGRGGTPKIGYDSRVGVGVYTDNQGSLSNAINQHLSAGQPRNTLGRTGSGLQGAANAKGHVPNFSFEGTDAAASGMGIGMLAFAFMGMGETGEKASKKMLQNTLLDEKTKLKTAGDSHRLAGEKFRESRTLHNTKMEQLRVEQAAKATPTRFNTTPAGLGGPAPGANIATLERELKKLNTTMAANSAAYDKARTAHFTQRQATTDASRAVRGHGQTINPATGKAYKTKGGARFHRGGAMMQKMALPMAFMGPMIGGMAAGGMSTSTREGRRDKAMTQGAGNALGYAGIGGMVGAMFTKATVAGLGTGGPGGAIIGAAIGAIVGGAAALTAGTDAYLKVLPELAAQSELASAALKDFSNGTSGFLRSLGDYSAALRDTTGRITAQDLKERRDVMMTAMGNIPEGSRGKMISTMNDTDRMKAVMSSEQLKLSALAESAAMSANLGKAQDENRAGPWGSAIFEAGNWNVFSDKFWSTFKTGEKTEDPIAGFNPFSLITKSINPFSDSFGSIALGNDYQHLRAAESAQEATGRADDTWFDSGAFENPLMRTKDGVDKLDQFTTKFTKTLDLSGLSTAQLTAEMKKMSDVFDVSTTQGAAAIVDLMAVFNKLGGDTRAIKNATHADAQYIAAAYVDRLQAMIVDAEMTELLTKSINSQKDAADRARESMERLQDVLQTVYMRAGNAVRSLSTNASTSEDIRGMRSSGNRGLRMQEMGLATELIKPFLGPEQSQKLQGATNIAGILSNNTTTLERIDSSIRKDLLKGLAGEFGKSSTNMTKAFQSAVRGDRSKLELYLTKAGRTRPQANALASLTSMVGDKMKSGMGTTELMKFVENQLATNASLAAIRSDNTIMQNVLESIRTSSENGNASLLKVNEQLSQQLNLNELQNVYAQELIRVQKTLSYQGGISSYAKGPHSGLLAMDSLSAATQGAPRSISPTISEGIASFQDADMFKNFFGAGNIPKKLMGDAIAGRAQQMAQTAQEYEIQTGTELPGWMKDMGSEGTIEAATNQVQASLKDAVPAKLEEVRSQILKLQETLVSENANVAGSMGAQFLAATETVFGNGAQKITGGGRGTILSLIEQQAKLSTMRVNQRKAVELQVDTEAVSTRQDSARLDLLKKSNSMIRAFRNMMMGNKWKNQKGSGQSQQAFVTDMIGGNLVAPQDVGASMSEIKEMFEARMNKMARVLKNVGEGAGHAEIDYRGMSFEDALASEVKRYKDIFSAGIGMSQGKQEDWEDLKIASEEQGFFMGRIGQAADKLGDLGNEMFTQGGYQGLIEEYNQATDDLRKVNQDRMAAERGLIQSINDFSSQYGHSMITPTVGLGPPNVNNRSVGPSSVPAVPYAVGGIVARLHRGGGALEALGFKPKATDTIPAMLSPGEFIVNSKSSKRNRALLEFMNSPVRYAAGGGLFSNQYGSGTPSWRNQNRPAGMYGSATPQALDPSFFYSNATTQARTALGMSNGQQGFEGRTKEESERMMKAWKDGVDKMIKMLPKGTEASLLTALEQFGASQDKDAPDKHRKRLETARSAYTGNTDHDKSMRKSYDDQIKSVNNMMTSANHLNLSMREMAHLWKGYLDEGTKAAKLTSEANRLVQEMPKWFTDLETTFTKIPTSLEGMKKTAKEWKKRGLEINKEIQDIDIKLSAITGNTPAATQARQNLQQKRARLRSEDRLVTRGRGQIAGAISREESKPGEVTDYTKRVREAQKRQKEGMRNLLGDIYGRYEKPSDEEATEALREKYGNPYYKPSRREKETYQLENSQWKGMTNLGDSFINPQSQKPMIGDYTNQMNKAVSDGLADKFEASGLDLSDFMKGEGLTMTSAQKEHGQEASVKRMLAASESGKHVPLSPEKKKAMVDQERKEAAQMMRGEIFFRRLGDGSGMTEKRNVDGAGRRAGYWGIGGQATGDIAMDSYEMKQNIKDRPEVQRKVENLDTQIRNTTKEAEDNDEVLRKKKNWLVAKRLVQQFKGTAGPYVKDADQPYLQDELAKKAELEKRKLKLTQDRAAHQTFLKTQTPEALKKLETDYDTQWNKRASAAGLNKDEMLTDEFGTKLAPHKMAEYLNQPKFKGTLDMGKLSQEYDKYSGSMDRSFNVMQNLKTATEFRTKVQQRFARVAKEAAKNGLSVNATMSAMANEMKKVALDMKLAKGEISGRTARAGNQQYYQGKVNDGTYGMGDMGGQFTSHFIRNAKDDMQDLKDLIDSTAIGMRDGFKKAFKEFAFGTKSSKEAFRDLAMDITSNIFSRMLDFSSENFMSYLMGQRHASGGLVKGYANGGRVTGGTGPRSDDVPMFGSGGEYVIRADSAKRIGYDNLEKLNSLKGYSRGGGISAVLRNQIDFDNPEQPKKMIKNIDPMFSILGQENQSNPQNKERFEREEAFYSHRKSEYEREKANAEKMKAFREKKKQMIKSGWMSAAMSLVSAGAAQWGDTNAIGKFLNSTGGKTLVSAGIGGAFGGTKGAIAGGISGLGAGLLGKWQKEDDAKKAMEFEKDLSEMMAKPSFQKQLALQKERQGLNTTGAPDELHMWGAQNVPQEFKNVYKDRARLSKIESELHDLNPAFRNPNRQATKAKGFWEGLRGGASKIGKGIKDTPGALWKGAKAPFGADFWGNPGMDLFTNPFRRQARGGLVRRALGGIVSNPTGQFQEMSRSFSSSETMDTGSNAMTVDGTSSLMGGLGMVKDSEMYSNGGGMRNFGLDNVLARVSKGEFIFSPKSTSYLGADALDRLNRGDIQGFMDLSNLGNMKGYAEGGYVGAGLPSLSTGGDSGGGSNTFDVVNQNLVKLIDSVDGVRDSIEQDSGEDSPNRSSSGGSKGTREIANNISITVNIDKNGEVSGRSENDNQEGSGGKGDGDEKDQDRKDKDKNKALGQMMEMEILKVITEQKRPGGLLDDKANSR